MPIEYVDFQELCLNKSIKKEEGLFSFFIIWVVNLYFSVEKPVYDQAYSSKIKYTKYIKGGTFNIFILSFYCYSFMSELITNCK